MMERMQKVQDFYAQGFLTTIAIAAAAVLSMDGVQAECAQLPGDDIHLETALNDKLPFASAGVIWAAANGDKHFNPTLHWRAKKPTQTIHFVLADNATGQPISSWPYPLGRGLYVGMTGTFTATVSGEGFSSFAVSRTYSQPMQAADMTSLGPSLFSVTLPRPGTKADIEFDSKNFRLYLVCPGGGCDYSQAFSFPKRIRLIANHDDETDYDGNSGFVCSQSKIAVESHCTLSASPMNIVFRDLSSRGAPGVLEETKTTQVTVTCRSGAEVSKREAHIRVYPERIDANDPALARFTDQNGRTFQGIGLVYNLNARPACTGSTARLLWNSTQTLGDWKSSGGGQLSAGTIYWGLCRVPDRRRDTGQYGTTATVSFWVD